MRCGIGQKGNQMHKPVSNFQMKIDSKIHKGFKLFQRFQIFKQRL